MILLLLVQTWEKGIYYVGNICDAYVFGLPLTVSKASMVWGLGFRDRGARAAASANASFTYHTDTRANSSPSKRHSDDNSRIGKKNCNNNAKTLVQVVIIMIFYHYSHDCYDLHICRYIRMP